MLAITDAAAQAISALTAQEGKQDGGGLRLAVQDQQGTGPQLALSVADQAEAGDEVLGTQDGAKVFLESQASQFLGDKVLDVQQDAQGQLSFAVMPQAEAQPPTA